MIPHGLPIYVALEPVDMRLGFERLGGMVREKMAMDPRSRALFVLPRATLAGDQHVVVSDAIFDVTRRSRRPSAT